MFQRDRERSLDCNHRVTTNQSTNQKPSPLGEGGADRRRKGGTSSQTKTAPQPTHLPQRLQSRSPKKPSPLGEGGADRRRKGGTRSQIQTAPQPTHLPQRLQSRSPKKPSPLGEGGADRRRKGGTHSQTKTASQQRHRTKSPLNGTEGRWARQGSEGSYAKSQPPLAFNVTISLPTS